MKHLIKKILKEEIDKSLISRIGTNDKIHISKGGDLKFKNVPINEQEIHFKPKGLWFSFGTEWIDFVTREYRGNNYSIQNVNVYDIETNDSKILTIGMENESLFLETYGVENDSDSMNVDWKKVASDWSGVEILINPRELNERWLWSTWDIPSGCVWDISGIKSITKI